MSADGQADVVVDTGPQIITVPGQDGHVIEQVMTEVKQPAEEVKQPAEEVKKVAAGSEEQVEVESERDDKGRFKPDAKTRIAQLTAARREAEREAAHWRDIAQGKVTPPAKEAPAAEVKQAPTRDQFADEESYLDALTDHKVEIKLAARDEQAKQTKELTSHADSWNAKLVAARAEISDFDEILDAAEIPVEGHVASLIMEHDQGAKVLHHFATNPAELEKINAMTPAKAAFAIAEVASQFKADSASSSKPAAAQVKKVSEAPPPAARNVGSGRSTTVPLGEMSMEDYVVARKAQGASWAR